MATQLMTESIMEQKRVRQRRFSPAWGGYLTLGILFCLFSVLVMIVKGTKDRHDCNGHSKCIDEE